MLASERCRYIPNHFAANRWRSWCIRRLGLCCARFTLIRSSCFALFEYRIARRQQDDDDDISRYHPTPYVDHHTPTYVVDRLRLILRFCERQWKLFLFLFDQHQYDDNAASLPMIDCRQPQEESSAAPSLTLREYRDLGCGCSCVILLLQKMNDNLSWRIWPYGASWRLGSEHCRSSTTIPTDILSRAPEYMYVSSNESASDISHPFTSCTVDSRYPKIRSSSYS